MSDDARSVLTQLIPAALLCVFFLGGFALYLLQTKLQGRPDREMRDRGASLVLGPFLRDFFAWLMSPLMRLFLRTGVSASYVTALALVLALGAGITLANGIFALGGWLLLASGFCDFLDGRIARSRGEVSRSGALLDSFFDRVGEGAVFIGLAWFYRDSWVLLIVTIGALASQLVSYLRSRCESVGVDVSSEGILLRPERVAILGTCLCLSPIVEILIAGPSSKAYGLAITGLAFVAIMSIVTALQRLSAGLRRLREEPASSESQRLSRAHLN